MESRSPAPRHLGWQRSLVTGLLSVLLLFLSVDLHRPGDGHEPILGHVGHDGGGSYIPEASHPDQPAHVEPATSAERPSCPACLLRLQTTGSSVATTATAILTSVPGRFHLPETPAERAGLFRPAGARAPPRQA